MREILFRGKRVDNGEWVEGSLYVNTLNGKCAIQQLTGGYEVVPETVGQYTGLTNKNGEKIFEGDVLDSPRSKGVVKYSEARFILSAESKVVAMHFDLALGLSASDHKIIGNIHDNPELLKEVDK